MSHIVPYKLSVQRCVRFMSLLSLGNLYKLHAIILNKIGDELGQILLKRYLCVFQGVEVVVSVWGPTGPG